MSPTERDLRAALRDGEGDDPDVDRIVFHALLVRALRRRRALTTAAAVVVVAGVATGGTALVRGGFGGGDSGSNSAKVNSGGRTAFGSADAAGSGAANAAGGAASGASGGAAAPSAAGGGTADLPGCPASLPRYALPGGSTPSSGGAGGRLFSGTVASAVVCSYGTVDAALGTDAPKPTRVVFTGADAATLATSLENAARTRPMGMCPLIRSADERALAVIGVAADGARLGTVTTTVNRPACAVVVTNGTARRYAWSPPPTLANRLLGAGTPTGGLTHGPVVNGGSPTR
jgi:hypothetical protein